MQIAKYKNMLKIKGEREKTNVDLKGRKKKRESREQYLKIFLFAPFANTRELRNMKTRRGETKGRQRQIQRGKEIQTD